MDQNLDESFFADRTSLETKPEPFLISKPDTPFEIDSGLDLKKNMTYLCMSYFCLAMILKNRKIMGNEHKKENFTIKKAGTPTSAFNKFLGGKNNIVIAIYPK